MRKLLMKTIYIARRLLFYTRLGNNSDFVGRVYRMVFQLAAPDLTAPIVFRDTSLYVDPSDRSYVPSVVGGYYEARNSTSLND